MQCNAMQWEEGESFNKIILNAQNFLFCFPFAHTYTHTQKYFSSHSATESKWDILTFKRFLFADCRAISVDCCLLHTFVPFQRAERKFTLLAMSSTEGIYIYYTSFDSSSSHSHRDPFFLLSSLSLSYLHKELFHRDDKRNKTVAVVLLTFT